MIAGRFVVELGKDAIVPCCGFQVKQPIGVDDRSSEAMSEDRNGLDRYGKKE